MNQIAIAQEKFDKGNKLTNEELTLLYEAYDKATDALLDIYKKEYRLVYLDISKDRETLRGYMINRRLIRE